MTFLMIYLAISMVATLFTCALCMAAKRGDVSNRRVLGEALSEVSIPQREIAVDMRLQQTQI